MHMLIRQPRAVEYAYDLESRIAADDHLLFVVDYNRSYLHLLLCEAARHDGYALIEAQAPLPHLGEDVVSMAEPGQHYERISEAVKKFIALTMTKDPSSPAGGLRYQDVKAVVLGGEASPEAMRGMRDVLHLIFTALGEGVLFESLDPSYLVSMGAAKAAKSQVDHPKSTREFVSMPDSIPDEPRLSCNDRD